MKHKQDAFGNYGAYTYKQSPRSLDLSFYGLLLLFSEESLFDIPNLLWSHTKLMFRQLYDTPFIYQDKETEHHFPVFAHKSSNRLFFPYFIVNQSKEGNKELISYQKNAIISLASDKNTLPNQLSLFAEEREPLIQEDEHQNINNEELQCWNEIGAFLHSHSLPISHIQYILPISINISELLYPFLIHLSQITSIHYHFITGNEINKSELFYLFESYRYERILQQTRKKM